MDATDPHSPTVATALAGLPGRVPPKEAKALLAHRDQLPVAPATLLCDPTDLPVHSRYVETFWLPRLGPTALWVLRRLTAATRPGPTAVKLRDLAHAVGVSPATGRSAPLVTALARLASFGALTVTGDPAPADLQVGVRPALPVLSTGQLRYLTRPLLRLHQQVVPATLSWWAAPADSTPPPH